jgi:hypothetical protein
VHVSGQLLQIVKRKSEITQNEKKKNNNKTIGTNLNENSALDRKPARIFGNNAMNIAKHLSATPACSTIQHPNFKYNSTHI